LYLPRNPERATLHILVESFSIFGVEFQYWMIMAVAIIAAAVALAAWTN
jgi:hypothetical protein